LAKGYRKRTRGRAVNGILLLDKPKDISSNEALQRVKRLYGAAKAGHTGSLDPLATGMLPLCFGETTKFSQFMLEADKNYLLTAKLGVRTASGDCESEELQVRPTEDITQEKIEQALEAFRGEIEQIPPMYSALKHQGQPLYKLARQGIEVERKARKLSIYSLELLNLKEDEIQLEVHCSKGTYVRSLVDDLGEMLGCGAHVTSLRRTSVSGLDQARMHTLEELEKIVSQAEDLASRNSSLDALLLPTRVTVENLPTVELTDLLAFYLKQGQPVFVPNTEVEGTVVLFNKEATEDEKFLGVGEVLDDGRVAPRRLVSTG